LVDAGRGWLIFALPPAEGCFPSSGHNDAYELYFLCNDLKAEIDELAEQGVWCSEVDE
jgi:hypothetical protein